MARFACWGHQICFYMSIMNNKDARTIINVFIKYQLSIVLLRGVFFQDIRTIHGISPGNFQPRELWGGGLGSCQGLKKKPAPEDVRVADRMKLSCVFPGKCPPRKLPGGGWDVVRGPPKFSSDNFSDQMWPNLWATYSLFQPVWA